MKIKSAQKNIPICWHKVKLGDLYNITSSKRVFQDEWTSEGVPFYRAREIIKLSEDGFVDNKLFISKKMFAEYKAKYGVPSEEDLLITGVGTIGIVYRVTNKKEFYFKDGNIIWFKNKGLASSSFIEQLYKTPITKNKLLGSSPITTVATYTIDAAKKSVVCLPPIPEQNRIVSVLETWDKAIEKLAKKIEVKKNIKKGLMQRLLTGKLRLPGFSEAWQVVKLGEICRRIKTGKLDANAMVDGGKYRFYTCAKNYYRINNYAFDTEALLVSGNGANVGYIHYYKGKFNAYQRTYVLDNFISDIIFTKYILDEHLRKRIFEEKCDGNTPYIKMDTLTDMKFKIPKSKEEQIAIANFISTADKELELLERKLERLKDQKKYLLNNLITGAIRTPEKIV